MWVAGTYVWAFVLLLGVLVFIHELGHFLVAKFCGVKVERFSLGFGGAILRRTVGETEYRISWLPLGGYVKMLGEVPGDEPSEDEVHRSFSGQPVPRRISIALAGPLMNLILPIFVVAGMVMSGVPTPTSLIGGIQPGSPAAEAGLLRGDRVVAIEGEPIWRWEDLSRAIQGSEGDTIRLTVERADERVDVSVVPQPPTEGEGFLLGVEHSPRSAILGLPVPDSPAARAGLRTGDRVVAVGGRPVVDLYDFLAGLEATTGPLKLEIARPVDVGEERIRTTLRGGEGPWTLDRLGGVPVDFSVVAVQPGSPAKKAGLEPGDLIISADGDPVRSFASLAERIRSGGGEPIALGVLRSGQQMALEVVPRKSTVEQGGKAEEVWRIGIHGGAPHVSGEIVEERVANPLRALWMGTKRTGEILSLTLNGIWQLVSGKIGMKNLAGPIGIGKFAGDYFQEEGWHPYLNLLAIISVNLAILNLLPIPILDGGQILLSLAEGVSGGPISTRTREIAQTGGLVFIVLLMGFAFWNDIVRHWPDFVGFFQGLL
jgi:regulator of sigma E protease